MNIIALSGIILESFQRKIDYNGNNSFYYIIADKTRISDIDYWHYDDCYGKSIFIKSIIDISI